MVSRRELADMTVAISTELHLSKRNEAPPVLPYFRATASILAITEDVYYSITSPAAGPSLNQISRSRISVEEASVEEAFEGFVIEVGSDSFTARICSDNPEASERLVEIKLSQVSEEDLKRVQPDAIFYWTVGTIELNSRRSRISTLDFQRIGKWSDHEIQATKEKAKKYNKLSDCGQGEAATC